MKMVSFLGVDPTSFSELFVIFLSQKSISDDFVTSEYFVLSKRSSGQSHFAISSAPLLPTLFMHGPSSTAKIMRSNDSNFDAMNVD
jgi:hypothetical protein